jgi:hypothetical protein
MARPVLEVADIFRRHLDGYRHSHALTMGQERAGSFTDGKLALSFLPPLEPICPEDVMLALRDRVSPGDHAADACIFTGNSPTIVLTAADCDDRRPESRTTIA